MFRLSMLCNEDIKSRISYSKQILPMNDAEIACFIVTELAAVGLGTNILDEAAAQVILRAMQGNLRQCRNLCYASLVATCLDQQRICTVSHVNTALYGARRKPYSSSRFKVRPSEGLRTHTLITHLQPEV